METIRVVSTHKPLSDILRLGADEVRAAIDEVLPDTTDAERQVYLSFNDIAADDRRFRAKLPVEDGLKTIQARQLLYSDRVIPVVDPDAASSIEVRAGVHRNLEFTAPPARFAGDSPVLFSRAIGPGSVASITRLRVEATRFNQAGPVTDLADTSVRLRRHLIFASETDYRAPDAEEVVRSQPAACPPTVLDVDERVRAVLAEIFPDDPVMHRGLFMASVGGVIPVVRDALAGRDIESFLACMRVAKETQSTTRQVQSQLLAQVARARQYMVIVEERLGSTRADEIGARIQNAIGSPEPNTPQDVLDACTKREQEIITTEYDSKELLWRAHLNNKCGHLPLASRLRRAVSADEIVAVFGKLRLYFSPKYTKDAMIPCRSCSFPTVCPHVEVWVKLVQSNAPQSEYYTALRSFANLVPVAGSKVYFCRVCNERLAQDVAKGSTSMFGSFQEDGKTEMWGMVMRLLSPKDPGERLLRYNQIVNISIVAGRLVDDIFPLTLRFRTQNRLNPHQAKLVTAAYVYAAVFNLIISEPDKDNTLRISVEGLRDGTRPSDIAKRMLQMFQKVYSGLMLQAEATYEQVSRQFKDAYVDILREYGRQIVTTQDTAALLLQTIMACDPAYHYLKYTAARRGDLKASKLDQFEFLVGFKIKDYLKRKPDKRYASFMAASLAGLGGIPLPVGLAPDFSHTQPEMLFYRDMYGARTDGGAAGKPALADLAFRQFVLYMTRRATPEQLAAYKKGQAELLAAEAVALRQMAINAMHSTHGQVIGGEHLPFSMPAAPITTIYDEDGNRHTWDIFVYQSKNKRIELTRAQAARRDAGATYRATKCSTCGVVLGETDKLDLAKTADSLRIKSAISRLLGMYNARCPEGGLHAFADGQCTQCGMPADLLTPSDRALSHSAAKAFFRKYYTKPPTTAVELPLPAISLPPRTTPQVTFDRTPINDVCRMAGISANELLNLGDAPGRARAEMRKAPRDNYPVSRAYIARRWYYQCVISICQGLPQTELPAHPDFDATFHALIGAQKIKDAVLFAIQRLAESLALLPPAFVKATLLDIIHADQMFCTPELFDFKVFKAVDVTSLSFDEVADVGEDMPFHEQLAAVSAQHDDITVDEDFVRNPFDITHDVEDGAEETNYNLD